MNEFTSKWEAEYQRALQRMEAATAGLSHAQLSFKPGPKKWSITECLEHVNQSVGTYLRHMEPAAAKATRKGAPPYAPGTLIGRFILNAMRGGPEKLKPPAPKPFRPATSGLEPEAVKQTYRRQFARLQEMLHQTDGLERGRITFGTPVSRLVRVSLAQAFEIHGLHAHRHLDQIERIKASAGYPAA